MANKEQTYTLKLDAEIGNLTASAEKVKKALSDIGALGKFPELDRGLEMIFKKLDKIKETAAAPVKGSTFTSLGKDAAAVGVQLNKLFDTLTELARNTDGAALDILPPDMLQKLRDIDAAMTAYNVTIDNAAKKTKELVDAENALSAAEGRLEGWRNKLADATAARNNASDTLATTREELDAAQQRIEATRREVEERRKAIKELEELYEQRGADKRKEIVDDKGNTRNLRKERNQLARLESGIPEQQEAISGLEEQIVISEKAVKSYNDRIAECNRQIGNWTAAVERNRNAIANLNESFEEGKIVAAKKAYADLRKEAQRLGVDISDLPIEGTTDDMEELQNRLRSLGAEISNIASDSLNSAKQGFEGSNQAVEDFTNGVENAKNECSQFNDEQQKLNSIQNNIKQFIGWAGAAKVLSAALRNAFADIKELDKAMTEIAVVTDFNIGEMWAQLPEYTERANELGLSITSVYEASALFYQQGLDTNEMVALSNETLKMAKIAGLDAAEATDRMTAALRGFNMELDTTSAQRVSDVYSKLAAITASDVDEISTAMTKTASIASSAGMEFETTAAFLSQIIETTRESAETAGTAMKTVIARFQELKKAPDEIGEIDGEIVDANQIEKALRSVGVSLRDAKGEFRELDDVFLELSSKWGDLDKNTQRYIATIAAGSRQQSRFIAMMQDYGRTQELVTAANNSAGASSQQYEKTLDSLDTKLRKLDNAWTEFSTGLMNSDFIKTAVDFLTKLLNAINKVTKGFEGFTGSLSKIGTMVAIFQTAKVVLGKFWDNIVLEVVKSAKRAMDGLNTEVKEGVKRTQSEVSGITSGSGAAAGGVTSTASMAIMSSLGISQMAAGRQNMKIADSQLTAAYSNLADAQSTEAYKSQISPLEKEQIRIKKEKRAIQRTLKGETDLDRQAEAQRTLNDLEQQENAILQKKKRINDEYAGKVVNSKMSVVDAEKQVQAAQQQSVATSKEALNTMAMGAQKAGQAIAMVGVGLGMVGQLFAEAGNEEAAEFFQNVGNIFTILGSAIMGVAALIPAFTTIFGGLVAKMVAGGISVQMAWWWVVIIVAVVVVLIGLIVALVKAAKDNSPEARLERVKEAADNAAEAADRATKAYEQLEEAFEGLENGYEVLDGLTKGTDEWNKATQQLNQSVLDLIQQYPELAKLVDNEGGVLTLDMDSEAVQQVLKDAQKNAIVAQNSTTMANLNVARAEDKVEQSNLNRNSKIGHYETYGDSTVWVEEKENTQALAKALASGIVRDTGNEYKITDEEAAKRLGIDTNELSRWYAQTEGMSEGASEALREFGDSLLETQAQEEAAFSAIAASAMQLADTLTMTNEQLNQSSNVVDDATSKAYYDEKMKELGNVDFTVDSGSNSINSEQKKMRDEAIRAQYGDAARIAGNKVTFRDVDGQQTEELTSDEIKALIANNYATNQTASAIEMAPAVIDEVISKLGYDTDSLGAQAIESVTQDQEGETLTQGQMNELLGIDTEKLKAAYQSLGTEQKKVFGTEQDYLDKIYGAAKIAKNAFDAAETSAQKMNFALKSWMTSDMATGFTTKLEQVLNTTGEAGVEQVLAAYDKLIDGKDEATAAEITALMNSIDWTNQEALLGLQLELEARYGYTTEQAANLTDAMGEAANATSSLAHTVRIFGELYHATQRLNAALEKTENLQWEYDRALKNGADETELSLILEKQRVSLENEVRTALEAHELALEAQVDAYARGANVRSNLGTTAQELVSYDEKTGTYDLTRLQQYIDAGEFGGKESESYKAVTDYVNELEEANKTAKDHLKTAKSSYEKLEQLQETYDEAYASIYSQVGDALSTILEQELEVQRELLETEQEANDKLIGKIQEDINERRAERDKEKTEEALSDLSTRLAYLKADSSGANALEIAELEKQLADEQQNYQDSLVDDAISDLEDANEKAAEQRDRQIALAEQQLEIYKKSDAFQGQIKSKLDEYLNSYNTHVKAVRRYEAHQAAHEAWNESTTEERAQITDAYNAAISGNWDNYIETYGTVTDEEKTNLLAIGTTMNGIENKEVYAQQWAESTEAERQQYQEAYDAIITGKWDSYITKYGTTTDAELVQFASIAASSSTIAADPGGWDAASTPLGQILQTAGVTTGMDQLEKEQFWTALGENTSKAANSSKLTSENTGGEIGDGSDMRELLSLIENHTAEAAYYDLKTQQEVSLADSRATAAADTLGFTLRNTADTNESGGYTSGEGTSSYVADMTKISNLTSSMGNFNDQIKKDRNTAVARQERLASYGLSSGIAAEQTYYNEMSEEDMTDLRGSLANGETSSGLLWANAVGSDYSSKVDAWVADTGDSGFIGALQDIVETGHRDGFEGLLEKANENGLAELRNKYASLKEVSKDKATTDIVAKIRNLMASWSYGSIDDDGDDGFVDNANNWNKKDSAGFWGNKSVPTTGSMKWELDGKPYNLEWDFVNAKGKGDIDYDFLGEEPKDKWVIASGNTIYAYNSKYSQWLPLKDTFDGKKYAEAYFSKLRSGIYTPTFKTGGLADFTGPAWLDGTKSRPEYVLNADQTERFFQLIDVLDRQGIDAAGERNNGDNYFDIDINVESLGSDYDVEQIAAKIRAIIVEDASYRNVNNISLTH